MQLQPASIDVALLGAVNSERICTFKRSPLACSELGSLFDNVLDAVTRTIERDVLAPGERAPPPERRTITAPEEPADLQPAAFALLQWIGEVNDNPTALGIIVNQSPMRSRAAGVFAADCSAAMRSIVASAFATSR